MKKVILKRVFIILFVLYIYLLFGNMTCTFATNDKIHIKKVNIYAVSNQMYTGKNIKPKVKITYKSKILKKDEEYKVSYKSNKKVGKATILIKGIGRYTGTIKKAFYITPAKTKIKSLQVYGGRATLKWKSVKYANGYDIYMSTGKNKKYKKIKTINSGSSVSYTKNNLKSNKDYYFKVKAFTKIGNKKVDCQKFSNVKNGGSLLVSKKLTAVNSTVDRNTNLKIACSRINGIILKPGQKFNWSKVIGIMTQDQGYKKAIAYVDGRDVLFVGGGVCQVSTTLYQCAKELGMKIMERHEHGKTVSYIEEGEDATVTFGLRNLIFENTTQYTIKIFASGQGSSTICQFYKLSN